MFDRIEEFIVEAREHLDVVEDSLLALEKEPNGAESQARYDRCFRSVHSIKGDAGFLGLQRIHQLTHAMESLLSGVNMPLLPRVVETLLAARDRLAVLVDDANRSQLIDIRDVLSRLNTEGLVRKATSIHIDLAEWNQSHPGGIGAFVRQTIAGGIVRDGRILIDACDLISSLPVGPVRWTATLENPVATESSQTSVDLHQSTGVFQTTQFSSDLSMRTTRTPGLAGLFCELAGVARVSSGQVSISATDLRRSLPLGPVRWTGECETSLTREELTSRFGFEFENTIRPPELARSTWESSSRYRGDAGRSSPTPAPSPPANVSATSANSGAATHSAEADKVTTLRIQVELLDRLMTLVGELTLVRNQSLLAFADEDGTQHAIIQRLNSVTSALQDATLRARMQPVGNLFNKLPRMIRDLARQLGKQVEIDLQGRDVEMDKTILEQLSDPLIHLIRNSVDHGIETPVERIAQGKPPSGRIVLSAKHEEGQIHIQIHDDGCGIDSEAVKAKALSLQLKTPAELNRMSPRELFSLILLPGFSTAKQVTEVSGRGVGMDVVKTNIEHMEGTLTIDSAAGLGCSMLLRLPLTLAIIPCLIVTVNGDRFAVPQRDLEEVVCLHSQLPGRIEQAFDTEVYRLRGKLLPIVHFSDVLQRRARFSAEDKAEILAAHAANETLKTGRSSTAMTITQESASCVRIEYILVLKVAGRRYGLVVDEVRGTEEVVVKPMHPSMKRVAIFTGATIMGDGRVALITDAQGIFEHARLSFESVPETSAKVDTERDATQVHRVLLFEYGPQEQFALPLLHICRIERVAQDQIEHFGGHEYVTINGVSTRVLRLNTVIHASALESDTTLMSLILPKFVSQPMGILVSRIVDTESLALDLQQHSDQDPAVVGSAIVRGRLTLFLDMHRLSEKLFRISGAANPVPANSSRRSKRLLLIDDTAFFREVVKRYLSAEGHEIATAIHGEDGLAQLAAGRKFDLIVSDIEMPVMDGWEFAREARRRGIKTPMLALTSLSGVQYETKAKQCGYDSYEVKLDHDRLVRKVAALLAASEALL